MTYFIFMLAIIIFTFALVLRTLYDGGNGHDMSKFGKIKNAFSTTFLPEYLETLTLKI